MSIQELDSLPEAAMNIVLFHRMDDPIRIDDAHGVTWKIGWLLGQQVKQRVFAVLPWTGAPKPKIDLRSYDAFPCDPSLPVMD